jgi:NDP-sugar pyrophosphorylase family protein
VVIGPRAVIAGPAILGAKARVESGALLHRTVVMHDSTVEAGAEIFSTILPPHSTKGVRVRKSSAPAVASAGGRDAGWPSMRGKFDRLLNLFETPRPGAAAR